MQKMFPIKNRTWWTKNLYPQGVFDNETAHAISIEAQWDIKVGLADPYWTVSIMHLPGWVSPLWGADNQFVYFRRPEGVWKSEIPVGVKNEMTTLHVGGRLPSDRIGSMPLADTIRDRTAWHSSMGFLRSPLDIDEDRVIKNRQAYAGAYFADFLGPALCRFSPESDDTRLVAEADDDFGHPPTFTRNNDWLFATDGQSGRVVAYSLDQSAAARKALDQGLLWLRFSGPFLTPFMVHVVCLDR
jgi:hypothetical protein